MQKNEVATKVDYLIIHLPFGSLPYLFYHASVTKYFSLPFSRMYVIFFYTGYVTPKVYGFPPSVVVDYSLGGFLF